MAVEVPERAGPEVLLGFFKALADRRRLRIVGILASATERSVQELAALLALREPTVSHHLSILRQLGLVRSRAQGNTRWYRLDHEALRSLSRQVLRPESLAGLAAGFKPDDQEGKVLANFLEGELLTEIPAQRKKRWVILKWLAGRFEPGTTYDEGQVNRILKRHHRDSATLRREMIGYRMLTRRRGSYRRNPEAEWRGPDS